MVLLQKLALGKKRKKKNQHKEQPTFLNTELPYDPVIQLLDGYPKKKKKKQPRNLGLEHQCSWQHYSQWPKGIHQWMNG